MKSKVDNIFGSLKGTAFSNAVDARLSAVRKAFAETYQVIPAQGRIKWVWQEEEYLRWKEYERAPRRWLNAGKGVPEFLHCSKYFSGKYDNSDGRSPCHKWFMDHETQWQASDCKTSKFFVWVPYGTWDFRDLGEFCRSTKAEVALLPSHLSFRYFHASIPLVAYRPGDSGMSERFGELPKAQTITPEIAEEVTKVTKALAEARADLEEKKVRAALATLRSNAAGRESCKAANSGNWVDSARLEHCTVWEEAEKARTAEEEARENVRKILVGES